MGMYREGIVSAINNNNGMVAIATNDSTFTIIEVITEWDLEVGDVISWENGYGLGIETYINTSRQTESDVFVQNHDVHLHELHDLFMY